ncbi:nucleosome assembly family protein [Cavenderia fasciculata]|uniref:Nucleosome assembly family protein n=1 Tax=Cavenderia fasciculata TaxID=261658 RepID=F4PTI0_CACFS|nr:nucleosome assembly family protein [Cavenderia fasciculata]EGG20862.1 nucleosome assembly family protein [Cavenderia fasciculata]|eukprot:XP_004358712.1 nucleosome assembly family protein [Cavenderia fasciculata]
MAQGGAKKKVVTNTKPILNKNTNNGDGSTTTTKPKLPKQPKPQPPKQQQITKKPKQDDNKATSNAKVAVAKKPSTSTSQSQPPVATKKQQIVQEEEIQEENEQDDDNVEQDGEEDPLAGLEKHGKELSDLQLAIDDLETKQIKETLKLEIEADRKLAPSYQAREKLIEKLPLFWVTAFQGHPTLQSVFIEKDIDLLSNLTTFKVETSSVGTCSITKLTFIFGNNSYLKNKMIQKEYKIREDGEIDVSCTKINWKNGNDITLVKNEEDASFFSWFDSEEDETELLSILKDEIWPNPMPYYNGQFLGGEDDEEEEEEEVDEE